MERLQKLIANSGYCSRRKAEELISSGRVKVNGEVIREMGFKASFMDFIQIDDVSISEREEKEYYLLNKPRGTISTASDDKNRKTIIDLIKTDKRIYPIGRLDYDTTGLIILTNDGTLTNLLTHPKNKIEKVYVAKINGILSKEQLNILSNGVIIDGKKTSRSKVRIKKIDKKNNTSIIQLIIHEGRNHQVKKMIAAVGYKVLKLKRESIAFLTLDGLKSGEYRKLSIHEVKKLYGEKNNQD